MGRQGLVFGVAVIEGFEVGWSRVVGGPPDALFQAGSISKPVTALAALELVGRGVLDLEADVNDRLTSWRLPGPERVSLRQLLGHTSGLGVGFYPGYRQGAEAPTVLQSLDGDRARGHRGGAGQAVVLRPVPLLGWRVHGNPATDRRRDRGAVRRGGRGIWCCGRSG